MISYLKQKGGGKIQESIAEYAFLKDLLIDGLRHNKSIIISRSDFDAFGFDILAQVEGSEESYKIQLKAYHGKAKVWDIHKSLLKDCFGTVVLIKVSENNDQLKFEYRVLAEEKRSSVFNRTPKKSHHKKCKLNLGDLVKVEPNEMLEKILKYSAQNQHK